MIALAAGATISCPADVRTCSLPRTHPDSSSQADRQGPPREDLPLPTQPPYTAFIGNLAFDLTEQELDDFFASSKVCMSSGDDCSCA
jgi:hypothetical protein